MVNELLSKFLESNTKFAQNYAAPPPLMKLREIWTKGDGVKGTVICKHYSVVEVSR